MTFETELSEIRGTGDLQAVIDTAIEAAEPAVLDPAGTGRYAFVVPAGATLEIPDLDKYADIPRRKKGLVVLHDAVSLAAYLDKHDEVQATDIYADITTYDVVAVINGSYGAVLGWGDHRARLLLSKTPAWRRWESLNNQLLEQVKFAEHIETSLLDIVNPPGAQMLELAQSFQAHTKVRFESARHLDSGQRQLVYTEDTTASAGPKGEITIPKEFELGLIPFEGCEAYKVTARLRYRLNNGTLTIGYVLDRPEDVLRAAFDDVLTDVEARTQKTALRGTPPTA